MNNECNDTTDMEVADAVETADSTSDTDAADIPGSFSSDETDALETDTDERAEEAENSDCTILEENDGLEGTTDESLGDISDDPLDELDSDDLKGDFRYDDQNDSALETDIDENTSIPDRQYIPIDEAMDKVSDEEKEIYSKLPLEVGATDDREALIRSDIDFLSLDAGGSCNLDTMQAGKPPLLNGTAVELHHIGQSMDAPLAELTIKEHRGKDNFSVFHDLTKDSEIDRPEFNKEKDHYWRTRVQDVIEKEINDVQSNQ